MNESKNFFGQVKKQDLAEGDTYLMSSSRIKVYLLRSPKLFYFCLIFGYNVVFYVCMNT